MSESNKVNGNPFPAPELHPEKPPPNIPIPGTPTIGGEKEQRFICTICGEEFKSKKELQEHMKKTHISVKSS